MATQQVKVEECTDVESGLPEDKKAKSPEQPSEAGGFAVEATAPSEDLQEALLGWRQVSKTKSLDECNGTIRVPAPDAPWYYQYLAYVGVGFMISVG